MNRYIPGYSNFLEQCRKKADQRSQLQLPLKNLIERISVLPPEKMAAVKKFVDSLSQQ